MVASLPLFVLVHRVLQPLHEHSNHLLRVLQREVAYAVLGDEARFVLGVPDDRCEVWVCEHEGGWRVSFAFVCEQQGCWSVLEHVCLVELGAGFLWWPGFKIKIFIPGGLFVYF